jgi:hypothetical protein
MPGSRYISNAPETDLFDACARESDKTLASQSFTPMPLRAFRTEKKLASNAVAMV